jgi:anti-sigma regulatory factor (Ser/Thr protein kinase)
MNVSGPIQIRIYSQPAHLPVVRSAVEKFCEALGFDSETAGRIVLAVDEALTNIIRHAYDGRGDQRIDIELAPLGTQKPGGLRICLRDYGKGVSAAEIKSRDLDRVRPGGLGVHIMTTCMDSVEYKSPPGGGTELTLVKYLPALKDQP